MENKLTALEFYMHEHSILAEQSNNLSIGELLKRSKEIENQSKEMEKEQIIEAHIKGHDAPSSTLKHYDAEQYYNETYGSKDRVI